MGTLVRFAFGAAMLPIVAGCATGLPTSATRVAPPTAATLPSPLSAAATVSAYLRAVDAAAAGRSATAPATFTDPACAFCRRITADLADISSAGVTLDGPVLTLVDMRSAPMAHHATSVSGILVEPAVAETQNGRRVGLLPARGRIPASFTLLSEGGRWAITGETEFVGH